ncbi:hypothetical protein DEU56DRAFT_911668 [Suillus clintonianus]|uniref:uncharacterized protein n=1 Tax=Suillus clintonianus TaxID=1904413 RepID=UPI001B86039E|nr:uncharacterized protein DEU56DRAFT_911668 [Suillus clintonianus]KAG2140600.1 hypothetical protein DEU56DRAFT_911668 [Suillus clintonianus]
MTSVSSDPSWWPSIDWMMIFSYFAVLSSIVVIYDWALTCGQEFELIWVSKVLYREQGIQLKLIGEVATLVPHDCSLYWCALCWDTIFCLNHTVESPILEHRYSTIFWFMQAWIFVVVNAMLGVIMMARIHAMYQGSQRMLIFLVIVWLASTIASGVIALMANTSASGVELVLSGDHQCSIVIDTNGMNLNHEIWIPTVVWEIIALFLAVWIVAKHFYELRQLPAGPTFGDCYIVLIRSHVWYFVAFAAVSFFNLGLLSPKLLNTTSVGSAVYSGIVQFAQMLQMFVLGPRLILSTREYHAKIIARSDGGTGLTTIAFQELRHVPTSGSM